MNANENIERSRAALREHRAITRWYDRSEAYLAEAEAAVAADPTCRIAQSELRRAQLNFDSVLREYFGKAN